MLAFRAVGWSQRTTQVFQAGSKKTPNRKIVYTRPLAVGVLVAAAID